MFSALRRWLALAPLVMPALAAAGAVIFADGWLWAGLGTLGAIVAGVWADGRRGFLLVVVAAAMAGGLHAWRLDRLAAGGRLVAAGPANVEIEGVVAARPTPRGGGWFVPVRIDCLRSDDGFAGQEVAESGRVVGTRIWWHGHGELPLVGTRLAAPGLLRRPQSPRNPGEFDLAGWLHRKGVWAAFEPDRGGLRVVAPTPWRRLAESWRSGFREAIVLGLDTDSREAQVIRAMVLGERPPGDDELIEAFRNSGSLHVFAVSGLHVGLVGLCLWFVLRLLRVPRRWAVLVLVPAMFGYAWLAGLRAPATRAAWMAALLLGGFVLRRPAGLLNVLAAVALGVLVLDGHQLFLPGFQLSYGVVTMIALFGGLFGRWLSGGPVVDPFLPRPLWSRRDEWLNRARNWLTGSLGVSTAAWCGSAPLVGWHFRLFTPVAPLASLVLVPVVTVVLALALSAALLAPLSPALCRGLNRQNARVAGVAVGIAEGAAGLPGSHFRLPAAGAGERLVVFDLGYGAAAAMFDPGKGRVTMLDCGDRWSFYTVLLPALRRGGVEVDTVLLSHPDGGHVGGAVGLLDAMPPGRILLPVERARSPSFRSLVAAAPGKGWVVSRLKAGDSMPCGATARWEVVHVADPVEWDAPADARCAVLRLHWHGWRVLFLADTGFRGERRLLESGSDLAADVLVLGRSCHDPGATEEFIEAVAARAVVASDDAFPPEERLDGALRARLGLGGAKVLGQGETGAVIITAEPERLVLRGFVDGSKVVLERGLQPVPGAD